MRRSILATLAALLLLLPSGCGSDGSQPARRTTSSPATTTSGDVQLDDGPVGIAATWDDDLWVVVPSGNAVAHVVAGTGRVADVVPVPGTPLRVAAAEGGTALWVTAFGVGEIARIDAKTGKVTDRIPVGDEAEGVAEAFGDIWVVAQDAGLLVQIDPASRRVVRRIDVGEGVRLVAAGADALWLDDYPGGTLVRVDPRTHRVRRSAKICEGPEDSAVAGNLVWVTCGQSEELVALGVEDLREAHRVALPGTPDAITIAPDGSLLVVLQDGPTLVVADPTSGEELRRHVLGERAQLNDQANLDVVVTGKDAWVTSYLEDSVLRTSWAD